MEVEKRPTSPWKVRPIIDDSVNVVQSRELPLELRDQADDGVYAVEAGDTILDIAAQFYNGAWWYWWVIMDRNSISLWYNIDPGTELIIPTQRTVDLAIRARRRGA